MGKRGTRERLTYGRQDACARCGQDIEWHGREHGWQDRGGSNHCGPYERRGPRMDWKLSAHLRAENMAVEPCGIETKQREVTSWVHF